MLRTVLESSLSAAGAQGTSEMCDQNVSKKQLVANQGYYPMQTGDQPIRVLKTT